MPSAIASKLGGVAVAVAGETRSSGALVGAAVKGAWDLEQPERSMSVNAAGTNRTRNVSKRPVSLVVGEPDLIACNIGGGIA